jgi:hypothetical protein
MTSDDWHYLIQAVQVIALAYIAYLGNQARKQGIDTHDLMNSRLTQLLDITKSQAHAAGLLEGQATREAEVGRAAERGFQHGRETPLESRVGPNHLNAGPTDRPV